jgi:hypothetical protein
MDKIVKNVIDKFAERSARGVAKYGTTLADNNTDDFLTHLQEELMDAVLYIEKLKQPIKKNKMEQINEKILMHFILALLMYGFFAYTFNTGWAVFFAIIALINIGYIIYYINKL